ncbi:MAG: hypothetical protein HY898_28005 [Deltaproteobacteria bacterium]|nr:hypothetical protein [Deltaproteobacteria bacterium]
MSRRRWSIPVGLVLVLLLAVLTSGCSGCIARAGQSTLGIMPGVVNDPGNRSLRRAVLHFGLEQFCKELTHRGAPLTMRDGEPVMGRFFARTCNFQEMENGDVFVQFAGQGYAWMNVSLRVGFDAGGAIQYNQDFLMDGSTMYAYFRTRTIASTSFNTIMVERGGSSGAQIFGGMANPIAKQVVDQQLSRGFTVIRDSDGVVDFGLGVVEKGQRPTKPFSVRGNDRMTLTNERTEVHGAQLDFLGPFEVDSDGRALYLTAVIDGVPAIDVMIVRKDVGDQWLEQFMRKPGLPQPPQPPLVQDVIPTRMQWQKGVPLAKGFYYVVLDNSSVVGTVAPPAVASIPLIPGALASPPPAALVNVAVQLGDAP